MSSFFDPDRAFLRGLSWENVFNQERFNPRNRLKPETLGLTSFLTLPLK
ncbi:MAG: hypothetical protein ACLFRN_10895 [Halothece sp.]